MAVEDEIEAIRQKDFSRLGSDVYMDYAGCGMYPSSALYQYFAFLESTALGNPHSVDSAPSTNAKVQFGVAKDEIFKFLGISAADHEMIIVRSVTDGCRILAETFPWEAAHGSQFIHLDVNHTSVCGISAVSPATRIIAQDEASDPGWADSVREVSLFAYPLQCNMTGRQYFFDRPRNSLVYTLVDAASYCASHSLKNLNLNEFDFILVSFYKIFGYPTSLGALFCHRSRVVNSNFLRKTYFGGGTVSFYSASARIKEFKSNFADKFQDGTPPFLELLSIPFFINYWQSIFGGMDGVKTRCKFIAAYAFDSLNSLKHFNGQSVAEIYSAHPGKENQGPIVNFNLQSSAGHKIGHSKFRKIASLQGICCRAGSFCNAGALMRCLNLSADDMKDQKEEGRLCWNDVDIINGKHTGSIRFSFGPSSSFKDVDRVIQVIKEYFLERSSDAMHVSVAYPFPSRMADNSNSRFQLVKLLGIYVYPVKSCRGMSLEGLEWDIGQAGFMLDRTWSICDLNGDTLALKNHPSLIRVIPLIRRSTVHLEIAGSNFSVPLASLKGEPILTPSDAQQFNRKLSQILQMPVKIHYNGCSKQNTAPILVTNSASLTRLQQSYPSNFALQQVKDWQFRPNLLLSLEQPFIEEDLESICLISPLGSQVELTAVDSCSRCLAVNVNSDGVKGKEPFSSLYKYRRSNIFGIYCVLEEAKSIDYLQHLSNCETHTNEWKVLVKMKQTSIN